MKKVNILTDSMCHIPAALCQELEIHVVPLPFVWDGQTYLDFDMGPSEFFARLRTSASVPTTSGPTPGSLKEHFEEQADGRPVMRSAWQAVLQHAQRR
jgi:fatty acid-binding protein DegV